MNVSCQNTELQAFLAVFKVLSSLLKFMFNSAQKQHGSRFAVLRHPIHMRQFMCISAAFVCTCSLQLPRSGGIRCVYWKPFRKTFHHNAPSTACLFLSSYLQFFHMKSFRFFFHYFFQQHFNLFVVLLFIARELLCFISLAFRTFWYEPILDSSIT